MNQSTVPRTVLRVTPGATTTQDDVVACEEPMEIRVVPADGTRHSLAVTMRTPGADDELAIGFLVTEGALDHPAQVSEVRPCAPNVPGGENVINVHLSPGVPFDTKRFSRNVYTSSSCGVCGKTSLDLVRTACSRPEGSFRLPPSFWHALPETFDQPMFRATGGIHAAALVDVSGRVRIQREDVGRHNAVDKIVGRLFLDGQLPASDSILLLSGRAAFELVQKAAIAGIPAVASVGAPSSLAVELAEDLGMTLIGFLRENRFNVYAGAERVAD